MNDFLESVQSKIKNKINPEKISLIDKSYLHTKHQSFEKNKYHLKLVIKSKKLKELNKIEAHKLIFSILSKEIRKKIHAIEINIE
tara:strand:- start:43 stop:297 length:255 start_codon:yes stop_codon:yes gene_type:complete